MFFIIKGIYSLCSHTRTRRGIIILVSTVLRYYDKGKAIPVTGREGP
jgi:hypothetical protein